MLEMLKLFYLFKFLEFSLAKNLNKKQKNNFLSSWWMNGKVELKAVV
jgi:hypothetical protein